MRIRRYSPEKAKVLYLEQHLTMQQIANKFGVSKTAISNCLKNMGVSSKDGEWIKLKCDFCGGEIERTRARVKKAERHFCDKACYGKSIRNPNYFYWRHGQREAQEEVSWHFTLEPGMIVHHKDSNTINNDKSNLVVFASQADHMRCHRGGKCQPLWDGDPSTPIISKSKYPQAA